MITLAYSFQTGLKEIVVRVGIAHTILDRFQGPHDLPSLVCGQRNRLIREGPFFRRSPHPRDMVLAIKEDNLDLLTTRVGGLEEPLQIL